MGAPCPKRINPWPEERGREEGGCGCGRGQKCSEGFLDETNVTKGEE